MLVIMIASGVFLAMFYTAEKNLAFDSVERIMRDVNYGWLVRYIHMVGASMLFVLVYIHIFRGLYYGSYKAPRELLWISPSESSTTNSAPESPVIFLSTDSVNGNEASVSVPTTRPKLSCCRCCNQSAAR